MENVYIDEYGVTYSLDKKKLLKGNQELTEYTILPGTEMIEDAAWKGMESLKKIEFPEGLWYIGMYAFAGCRNITHVDLPSALQAIGSGAFAFCGLTDVILPDSLEFVFFQAFMYCSDLRFVVVQPALEEIAPQAFLGCHHMNVFFDTNEASIKKLVDDAFASNPYNFDAYRLLIPEKAFDAFAKKFPYHSGKMMRMVKTENPGVYRMFNISNHDCGEFQLIAPGGAE